MYTIHMEQTYEGQVFNEANHTNIGSLVYRYIAVTICTDYKCKQRLKETLLVYLCTGKDIDQVAIFLHRFAASWYISTKSGYSSDGKIICFTKQNIHITKGKLKELEGRGQTNSLK